MKYITRFDTLADAQAAAGLYAPHITSIEDTIKTSGTLTADTPITFNNDGNIIEKVDSFNGFEAVDLGMITASGKRLLWATCNVGATSPEQAGLYFAWGDTEGFKADEASGKWSSSWYSTRPGASLTSDITPDGGHDAARANMGGTWRMPTKAEMEELVNYGNRTWTTVGGVNGYKIVNSSDSSKYIFLPAAGRGYSGSMRGVGGIGYCWSSTFGLNGSSYGLGFNSGYFGLNSLNRFDGFSVRGVIEVD